MKLYCFAQSGNAYKVANYLNVTGTPWEAVFVDFFNGESRSPEYRAINEMGEVPVLVDGETTLTQSGVILDYLVEKTGQYAPAKGDAREVLRWVLWDNHKGSSQFGMTRFIANFLPEKHRNADVITFSMGRCQAALKTLDAHLKGRDWMVGTTPTAADFSCSSYLFYDEPFGMDRSQYPHIESWLENIRQLPNWKHPYDLMQGHPLPQS